MIVSESTRKERKRKTSKGLTANRACAGPLEDRFSLKAEHRS